MAAIKARTKVAIVPNIVNNNKETIANINANRYKGNEPNNILAPSNFDKGTKE